MQIVQIVHSCANVIVIYAGKCGCWYVCLVHPCSFLPLIFPPLSQVFFIHVCPCRWCRVCTREATAALGQFLPHSGHCCWWWFNQLQKRSLLNSDNLVLSHSSHCCWWWWWFNQLQKKPPSQQWQLGPASLCSLPVCQKKSLPIIVLTTCGVFLPSEGDPAPL